jgi:hypothetical protein
MPKRFRVTNDRAPNGGDQEFEDRRYADRYARTLNDRYPDAHARVVPVSPSANGRNGGYNRRLPRHTLAFEERVEAIEASGGAENPYAVAAVQFGKEGRSIYTEGAGKGRGRDLRASQRGANGFSTLFAVLAFVLAVFAISTYAGVTDTALVGGLSASDLGLLVVVSIILAAAAYTDHGKHVWE